MIYPVYITKDGAPMTGLAPNWEGLRTLGNGTDKSGSAPAVSEAGGGWYKFDITFGEAPWDVITDDLVGVIDADPTGSVGMSDAERYIPIEITLRGLALARIAHKAAQDKATGDIEIYQTDGVNKEMKLNMTDDNAVITRSPVGV
jgi:hypothetical protein